MSFCSISAFVSAATSSDFHRTRFQANSLRSFRRTFFIAAIPLLVLLSTSVVVGQEKDLPDVQSELDLEHLTPSLRKQIQERILPALERGDDQNFANGLMKLVSSTEPEMVQEVETQLVKLGYPSLKESYVEKLVTAVKQGLNVNAKKFKPELADYTVSGILDSIESELEDFRKSQIAQDPLLLPDAWPAREEYFWNVHVWRNRFLNLEELIGYANQIQAPKLGKNGKHKPGFNQELFERSTLLAESVREQFQNLVEREAELRVVGLDNAEEVLRTGTTSYDRLNAAFALELHGSELDRFFSSAKDIELQREMLKAADVVKNCEEKLASGREHGSDVIEKAVLLRGGAHWWFRGRYGASTMAYGLLKPVEAMNTPALMVGLHMPKERPEPIGHYDTETETESPGYERRHYYTWAIEQRQTKTTFNRSSKSSRKHTFGSDATSSTFW